MGEAGRRQTFKMNFQIVNTPRPNSVQNTCVFTAFEAPDSKTNLHLTLSRYKEAVSQLQSYTWRYCCKPHMNNASVI